MRNELHNFWMTLRVSIYVMINLYGFIYFSGPNYNPYYNANLYKDIIKSIVDRAQYMYNKMKCTTYIKYDNITNETSISVMAIYTVIIILKNINKNNIYK